MTYPKRTGLVASTVIGLLLAGGLSWRSHAQSEYLRGERMPYDTFDRLPKTDIDAPDGVVHVGFAPGETAWPKQKILDWVRRSAKAVATYYGRFPVKSLRLLLVPVDGPGVRGGTTWGYRGAAIRVLVGRDSGEGDLRRDWVLVRNCPGTPFLNVEIDPRPRERRRRFCFVRDMIHFRSHGSTVRWQLRSKKRGVPGQLRWFMKWCIPRFPI